MMLENRSDLPDHIEATVAAISDLHAKHYRNAGRMQQLVGLTANFLARPCTLSFLTIAIVSWVVVNLMLLVSGARALDAPPFPYLADAASIIALYLTTIILITQRHDDDLATRRDQLTLELAILSEQKSSKIISLLEELRREKSDGTEARDTHAEELAQADRPQVMLDQLQAAHQALD